MDLLVNVLELKPVGARSLLLNVFSRLEVRECFQDLPCAFNAVIHLVNQLMARAQLVVRASSWSLRKVELVYFLVRQMLGLVLPPGWSNGGASSCSSQTAELVFLLGFVKQECTFLLDQTVRSSSPTKQWHKQSSWCFFLLSETAETALLCICRPMGNRCD
jgi:hypothetical protein